nr:MotA/TolQ/ExbB proton channel family protein [Rhodopirellula sp. SWK7]
MKYMSERISDVLPGWSMKSLLVVLVVGIVSSGAIFSESAFAQDDAAAEFGADPEPEPPAVPDAPAPGAADNGGGDDAGGSAPNQSLLGWFIKSLGIPYLIVFMALSVTLVSLFVMNMLAARRDTLCPLDLIEEFGQRLDENDNQGAYDLAKSDESVLGQVLAAGLSKISRGYPKALEGMQEVGEEESMKLEHRLSYMALIGNLSPMIGLFGTVQGMIASFDVIANGGSTPKPSDLAAGISTALFTTLVGLFIAIPAIAAYNILRNRVARLLLEVGVESENLMSRFEDTTPKAGGR